MSTLGSPSSSGTVISRWLVVGCILLYWIFWLVSLLYPLCSLLPCCLLACLLEGCPVPSSAAAWELEMFTTLPKAYAKEPEKSLPSPTCLLFWDSAYSYIRSVSYIACWDSFTSHAGDWLCSHSWPCLICAYPNVSNIPNLIITFV